MNILEYIETACDSLSSEINEIDALILSQSSYFDFENYQQGRMDEPFSLNDFFHDLELPEPPGFMAKKNYKLLQAMAHSRRFKSLRVISIVSRSDPLKEMQFAAVTYELDAQTLFVSFRGTDSTLIGWKDDFNMAFQEHTATQISGKDYLEHILSSHRDKTAYVGGHSKGGNIAIYASMFCDDALKHQIRDVYDFDGPGFHDKIVKSVNYQILSPSIRKYIPQSSVVGILLNSEENVEIIKSTQRGVFQHDAFSWEIDDQCLKRVHDLTFTSHKFRSTLNTWLEDVNEDQRKLVINSFYSVIADLNIVDFNDFKQITSFSTIRKLINGYNNLDADLKKYTFHLVRQFIIIGIAEMTQPR